MKKQAFTETLQVRVSKELYGVLESVAQKEGKEVSHVVREALRRIFVVQESGKAVVQPGSVVQKKEEAKPVPHGTSGKRCMVCKEEMDMCVVVNGFPVCLACATKHGHYKEGDKVYVAT